ncbi:MAG: AmmeMemoRadiSam system radical SAM enzyme [Parcubacteria group bacterium CG1_02_40_82]|uniref:AmmeMemoRadiSam system radical SAM enzyme n=2 Tax=Candidatus Portnoyibacteriota TaxID=1817913 RepID=A0A2H0KS52_9BACT|nr:MAG: AmmeMemoRadiSam system radical SAM enzyme [Parcubacteria group bacterium CG1_02_40_82]PIQ74979.1 MAG: AmmeMemoRadiSam system radical SAM enzyme [Candidatus Portnoybacteria bacterium CG11_big_fil_rev_8_21_14_0_20_40_15]PIS31459.1 MAG: AmmeMemoRadiSam system radical SAM enzyme [Candidatus Portnoybacteria bacterium CG08_land_8_20_14_0_20_40_83]PJA64772.1 MAG: AmmeMemoRadiSam system radical SAM enzyme [Candidatus Portnoybacteria bacterium CG_4_9_14_3_um_filter_40_10]
MKESYLYQKLDAKKVRCQTCAHNCLILPGKRGICGVRENIDGKLYSLVYGKAIAEHLDPIEKKPFFHFLPGTYSLSVATIGCNLNCGNCQNWDISQASKDPKITSQQIEQMGFNLPPEKIVQDALSQKAPSISYTYTEPTIFLEYALDTMKLAKEKGLKNCWITNGFMSEKTLKLIAPYLDAANVDLKSFDDEFYRKNCGARLQPILDSLKLMKKVNIWVEVTTLVIPTLSDSEKIFKKIAEFIYNELGAETPWHVTQFSGVISYKLQHLPETPLKTLEKACQIGLDEGLKYVYSGNVPGLASEDTYCPKCRTKNIDRHGYQIERYDKNGKCYKCGEDLNLIFY